MTKRIKSVVYAEGGHDESKPDNNVISYEYYSESELIDLEEKEAKAAQKQALLDRLGITEQEAQLLLGGN